jgi:hypothetical protein
MRHPFELRLSDLEAIELQEIEKTTEEEIAKVKGGGELPKRTTEAVGEEGGQPTTLSLREEGGWD